MKRTISILILALSISLSAQANWFTDLFGFPKNPIGFVPEYCPQQYVSSPDNRGGFITVPVNIRYCVTQPTADWLVNKFIPGGTVEVVSFEGQGGAVSGKAIERIGVWPDKIGRMNLGFLAGMYSNNPEQEHPKQAERKCVDMIIAIGEVPPPGVGSKAQMKIMQKNRPATRQNPPKGSGVLTQ